MLTGDDLYKQYSSMDDSEQRWFFYLLQGDYVFAQILTEVREAAREEGMEEGRADDKDDDAEADTDDADRPEPKTVKSRNPDLTKRIVELRRRGLPWSEISEKVYKEYQSAGGRSRIGERLTNDAVRQRFYRAGQRVRRK
jgi:hypothetical protein